MPEISWDEVAKGALDNQPPLVKSAVEAARGFACGLYKNYEQYFGNTAPQGPLEGLKRGVWDKICGPGLPPVPNEPPPWNGDSCACIPYIVTHRLSQGDGQVISENATIVRLGPISGIAQRSLGPGLISQDLIHGACNGSTYTGSARTSLISGGDTVRAVIKSIVPQGGPPGTCQPPPGPPPPVPPPADRQSEKRDINISPNVTINVPVTLVSPTVNVDLSPNVEINVGPVNVNFGLGGINVDISPSFNPTIIAPTINLPPLPPGTVRPPPLPPAGNDCPPCEDFDYQRIEDAIEAERKYYATAKLGVAETLLGSGRSGVVALPDRTKFVRLTLTALPVGEKSQAGLTAPDVIYAGWCSWGRNAPGTRVPVHYGTQTYAIDEFCNQFSWTLYNGGNCQVEAIAQFKLEECQTDECRPV